MKQLVRSIICSVLAVSMLPLAVFAAENSAPICTADSQQITVESGEPFVLTVEKLKELFHDSDNDSLSYWIRLEDSQYIEVTDRCIYVPDASGTHTLFLKANDGSVDSEEIPLVLDVKRTVTAATKMLDSLIIHTGVTADNKTVLLSPEESGYTVGQAFDPQQFDYTLEGTFYDTNPSMGFRAMKESDDAITLTYHQNETKDVKWKKGVSILVKDILTAGKNEFHIRVGDSDQAYHFYVDVLPTLTSLSSEGIAYWNSSFDSMTNEYTVVIPETAQTLELSTQCRSKDCSVLYNGQSNPVVDISDCEKIEISVSKDGISNVYIIHLDKKPISRLNIQTEPEDAVVSIKDHLGNTLQVQEDGSYEGLFSSYEHRYTASSSGYVTAEGIVPPEGGQLNIILQKILGEQPQEVSAEWKNFRDSDNNMAIVETSLPINETSAKWIKDFDSSYPSVQIIVDDALIVMCNKTLYKLDLDSGEVLQTAEMAAAPNYGYTPPTYGAGMIFCPLANGSIQAFNAKTLESLWIYKDSIGGQSLSPITYADGYLYTGFWKQEKGDANFVCIDVCDEDTTSEKESKSPLWVHKQKGGFYWAGSVVVGNTLIVGTDDGEAEGSNGSSYLYAFDCKSGELLSSLTLTNAGDQRSSIAYDSESGRLFFTTKGGYLYSVTVNGESGELSNAKRLDLGMQSTSTPVLYKNRLYFGMGLGFKKGYLAVVDASALKLLFTVKMLGYPQGSVLLSTANESSGYLDLYMTYNNYPGGISLVRVKPNCKTEADAELIELYDAAGYDEHCISSLICGADGTIYYKNDSGCVFAIGEPSYQNVIKLIDDIGTVTLEAEGKILAARDAYDSLSKEDKEKVSNYSKLTAAEETLKKLKETDTAVEEVEKLIADIGTVSLHSKEKISKARKAYDKLSSSQKAKVENYKALTDAEKKYSDLVEETVSNVEELIDDIGTVTKDSQPAIAKARTAYDQLSEDLQELVENYDDLLAAEEALKKLGVSGTTAATAPGTVIQTVTQTAGTTGGYVAKGTEPTKSELLQLQEDLESVDSNMSYEQALDFLKVFYGLEENSRLALEDSDGLKILQEIVAKGAHSAVNGIAVEGLDWYIRVVASTEGTERVRKDLEKRLSEADLLGLWDIYLENVLTGQRYLPDETLKLKIPLNLLGNYNSYDRVAITHYNEVAEIEVLSSEVSGDYLQCDAVEFSYYAVTAFHDTEETIGDEITAEVPEDDSSWIIWFAAAAAGVVVLAVLLYFRFFGNKESEVLEELAEDKEE